MKCFILLATVVVSAVAQRAPFAGTSPKGVPDVASRFKAEGENNISSGANIGNRVGVVVDGTTERIPIDARGDHKLVDRIKDWPDENKPFWYVNAEAIEQHRGTPNRGTTGTQNQPVNNQGFSNQPINNRDSSGQQNFSNSNVHSQSTLGKPISYDDGNVQNRFGENSRPSGQPSIGSNESNSFNVVINNQWKTYVYDPAADAWFPKRN